ncbi:MAG TPA: ketopantoate reductase C-terminal domain-containing protein [Actinomycetota bacterium]|nr:ketopantoate reductase C-terminal domain-containing protein [Actinomycetota bacterium]
MELEALHGEVVRRARSNRVPVAVTETIYGLLRPWAVRNERGVLLDPPKRRSSPGRLSYTPRKRRPPPSPEGCLAWQTGRSPSSMSVRTQAGSW